MLNNGVKRIIEQVVNPKIMQSIKPKVDEIVCEHLGISLKERQEKIRQKQLDQQQKQQQNILNSPQSGGIVNLMSITFSSPPPGAYTELRPNRKISVFWVTGLKILGWVGTHILKKYIILFILKGKMIKIIYFFPENLKNLGFTSRFM